MSNVSNDPRNLAEIYNSFLECDGNYHTGKPFQDVYSTIFVIAWVQLVPGLTKGLLLRFSYTVTSYAHDLALHIEHFREREAHYLLLRKLEESENCGR